MSDAPPDPPRIPRENWVLVIAAFVVAVGYGFVAPILPGYAKGFGASVTAASMIVSVFDFTRVIGAPPAGWIVERLGERTVYMAGLLIRRRPAPTTRCR